MTRNKNKFGNQKILIIGNGFDLAHGLPTRYGDFLEFAERVMRLYDERKCEKDEYYTLIDNWQSDDPLIRIDKLKESLKNIFNDFNNSKLSQQDTWIAKFHDYLKDNIWYQYIYDLYTNLKIPNNWINFENEISFIIQAIDSKHTSLTQNFLNLNSLLLYDVDENLRLRLEKFTNSYSDIYSSNDTVSDIRTHLYTALENLINAFEIYLSEVVEKIEITPVPEISNIEPNHVISFNYTNTYERLYAGKKSKVEICYIHGTCGKNNIVLGIDEYLPEEERREKVDFAIFKKFVQRIRNHNDVLYASWMNKIERTKDRWKKYHEANKNNADNNITKRDFESEIYIYGHSLNVTDKDILQRFLASPYTRIYIHAKTKVAEGNLISNLIRIIGEKTVITKSTKAPPQIRFGFPVIES